MADLDVEVHRRAGPQDRLLFLVHGYGEPPSMFLDHLEAIDPVGRYVVVTPIGPFEKKGRPIWHRALSAGSEEPIVQFHTSCHALQRTYGRVVRDLALDPATAVVGGFSQGAGLAIALTLAAGPDAVPRPAGALAFCGFAPVVPGLTVDLARVAGLPLFLSVATDDVFIDLATSRSSAATLAHLGFAVSYHELACRHEITPDAAARAGSWLAGLGADPAARPSGDPVPPEPGEMGALVDALWRFVA